MKLCRAEPTKMGQAEQGGTETECGSVDGEKSGKCGSTVKMCRAEPAKMGQAEQGGTEAECDSVDEEKSGKLPDYETDCDNGVGRAEHTEMGQVGTVEPDNSVVCGRTEPDNHVVCDRTEPAKMMPECGRDEPTECGNTVGICRAEPTKMGQAEQGRIWTVAVLMGRRVTVTRVCAELSLTRWGKLSKGK